MNNNEVEALSSLRNNTKITISVLGIVKFKNKLKQEKETK